MEQIEYTRTVVPSSMRSPYWKYFGFPSDSGNNILTRQKIVCTICNTAIAYNKNTSNLRTHLMSKHVEIFKKIVTPSKVKSVSKQNTSCYQYTQQVYSDKGMPTISETACDYVNNLNSIDTKRRCIETHDDEVTASLQSKDHYDGDFLNFAEYSDNMESDRIINGVINPTDVTNKIDLGIQSADYIGILSSSESEIVELTENSAEVLNVTRNEKSHTVADLTGEHEQQSMYIMLADLIQTDLLPLDTIAEHGFCKYNQQLTGLKIDENTVSRVEKVIEARFMNIKQMVTSHVNRLSQYQPYSLSLEIYKDNEGQKVLNIYFNYLNDNQMELINILYTSSIICTKTFNISELLADINLKNCGGVVVTCPDDVLGLVTDFGKSYELPLIECLETVLTRCLHKIFEQTEFCADYEQLFKIILENNNQPYIKRSNIRPRCKWRKLNFLACAFQNIEETKFEELCELRRSFEYLKPLKMALDIIASEPIPLCSLTRPLIKKLFEEHFSSLNQEESTRISKIQKILQKELYERIMTHNFLNEVTFFDTRFHRDFALQEPFFDITDLKSQVVERFNHIFQLSCISKPNDINTDSVMYTEQCSSLKTLFKRDVSLTNTNVSTDSITNLDLELELQQYQVQESLDLDQSPVLWWQQQSNIYKQLSKIAKYYLSIPCCCLPRLCRITLEQRYAILDRRKNLSQFCSTESKLWYLHYNEAVAEL